MTATGPASGIDPKKPNTSARTQMARSRMSYGWAQASDQRRCRAERRRRVELESAEDARAGEREPRRKDGLVRRAVDLGGKVEDEALAQEAAESHHVTHERTIGPGARLERRPRCACRTCPA